MLVVLHGAPGAAPSEAMFDEELVAEIIGGDLVTEVFLAIDIRQARGGLDDAMTVFLTITDVRVVEGIDVDGQAVGMLRQVLGVGHDTIVEAAGVVGAHLALVVAIVVVGQGDLLDGITRLVELTEDREELGGNQFVADEFALMGASVVVIMAYAEIAQVGALDMGVGVIAAALHVLPDAVGDGLSGEPLRKGLALQAESAAKPDYDTKNSVARHFMRRPR